MSNEQIVLMVKDGSYVTVWMSGDVPKLQALDLQEEALVHIWWRENKNKMAFRFLHGNDSYLPVVDNNNLKLKKAAGHISPDKLSSNYWFKKINLGVGDHYALQAVATQQYLCIKKREIVLRQDKQDCASFRAETRS